MVSFFFGWEEKGKRVWFAENLKNFLKRTFWKGNIEKEEEEENKRQEKLASH